MDQPQAIGKVQRGPDGQLHVVYVDVATGAEINNPNGYEVLGGGGFSDTPHADPVPTGAPAPTAAQQVTQAPMNEVANSQGNGGRAESAGYSDGKSQGMMGGRSQSNNFGYTNKPTGLGAASFAPGPFGMVGKAINGAINMNNTGATNAARESMGQPPAGGFVNGVKGAIHDNKGYVGDYSIGDSKFSVGLEAQDPFGRTTLTPQEANARAVPFGGQTAINALSKEDTKARQQDFKDGPFGKTSIAGSIRDGVNSFLGGLFGDDEPAQTSFSTSAFGDIHSYAPDASLNNYPSAPKAFQGPSNVSGGWTGTGSFGGFSTAGGQSRAEGISPQAAKGISDGGSKGPKGLY